MSHPVVHGIAPFFIVRDAATALAFYRDKLQFDVLYQGPGGNPFFAVLSRDGAMLMVKAVGVEAQPNWVRHPDARWDAYVHVSDPDTLATEFSSRGVNFSRPLMDTHEGLRGFEVKDADGYVLFFGRPGS